MSLTFKKWMFGLQAIDLRYLLVWNRCWFTENNIQSKLIIFQRKQPPIRRPQGVYQKSNYMWSKPYITKNYNVKFSLRIFVLITFTIWNTLLRLSLYSYLRSIRPMVNQFLIVLGYLSMLMISFHHRIWWFSHSIIM